MTKLISIEEWARKKNELMSNIDVIMEKNKNDREIYEIMKELLESAKLRSSIYEFYDNELER